MVKGFLLGLWIAVAACGVKESTSEDPAIVTKCVTFERGVGNSVAADTYVKPNDLRSNFGTRPLLRVSASDETLLRFDVSSIPASATITKATLDLFADGAAGDGTILVHRITAPWTETGVTYASFHQAFAPDLVAALRIERKTTQKSVDLTGLVATWVRGAQPNYGVELDEGPDHHPQRERDCDDDNDPTLFVSSEGPAHRPELEVCYTMFVDECAVDPCHNGGTCTNTTDAYTCACAAGFTGPNCDTAADHCAANPCQNGGGCTNTTDGYTCACAVGFSGTNCETNINDCASSPCQNGGVCTDGIASYTCACQPGYDGANCEHLIDNCDSAPCHNGGSCVNGANSFTCECPGGFTGPTCDTNIDDCVGNACVNGSCVDGIESYTCACAPDWGGSHCDVNLDSCSEEPCLNGGACTDGFGTYTCQCPTGYTGANCEIDIDDCSPNPCDNGGVCVDGVASYTCTCPSGFTGSQCETVVPPPVEVRIDGTCYAICQDADPTVTGWGWENDASCVNPGDPAATSSPFCSTAIPQTAYEAPNAAVTDATTSVATIPRPPYVTVDPAHDCPYADTSLVAFDPTWIAADNTIEIPAGIRVLVRGNADLPTSLLIARLHVPSTSELIFADQPATYNVTDIVVDGTLRLGSATCRLESQINFVFDTVEDTSDPTVRQTIYNRMGLGIMVGPSGVLEMFGHLYQPTWTRLAATANPGDTTLTLADSVDWQAGEQLVIATSTRQDYPLVDQNEQRGIIAVSGNLVTLDAPVTYQHYGGSEYQVEVGLLSHNLAFSTAQHLLDVAPFGGHIMVHSKNARVSGVSLSGMGQQNFLARYPFHFHLSGDVGGASYFTDSSVMHSNWRCAVIHRTDHSIVSRNVAYDNFGNCYYIEDGVEMNNEVSFNLAIKTKIMGPTDAASISAMQALGQPGFTLAQSADYAQPADRAAAGFYITNGNNKIIGNASSGGFAGFSFPNLPQAIGGSTDRIFPILYGASYFDGNTAHSAGYLWSGGPGACIYIGGTLTEDSTGQLTYVSGRSTDFNLLRHQTEIFNNTKTFLCESGITHWGSTPRIVNFEAWDNNIMATLFGSASIQSSLSVGATGNTAAANKLAHPLGWWQRGFQFYDTDTQTILKDVSFQHYHHDPATDTIPGWISEWDNCALESMDHSDEYTPQRMNSVAGLHFIDVDDAQRLCVSNTGTLSSRNFNVVDTDGSMSGAAGDPLPVPRLVASSYAGSWQLSSACVAHDAWGAIICPFVAPQNVAAVAVQPNANVRVTMYGLDNTVFGDNWYSGTTYYDVQMTGPSNAGWHHEFPGGVPDSFYVEGIQIPDDSFVLLSFTVPDGVSCSVADPPFTAVADLPTLLASTTPVFTTAQDTCFVRIPPTNAGSFEASGLSVPNILWVGNPQPRTFFTVTTGCTAANPACATVTSKLPTLP